VRPIRLSRTVETRAVASPAVLSRAVMSPAVLSRAVLSRAVMSRIIVHPAALSWVVANPAPLRPDRPVWPPRRRGQTRPARAPYLGAAPCAASFPCQPGTYPRQRRRT